MVFDMEQSNIISTHLAPFACFPENSRGRYYNEPESKTRDCFQRDRDRIIHSTAFRRLQYKTQVFVNHEGDHYRTRLTHTLEVSQIARTLARCFSLNEDLTEALSLAHDLGHPPFGHAGEQALAELMMPFGGFDHNAQTLSVIVRLEKCYPNFSGLNLSWETLEGIVKHNGPLIEASGEKPLPREISDYNLKHDLELASFASGEAQVAALADDIAYNNHDIDDGLRAGLFVMEDLFDLPLVGEIFRKVIQKFPRISKSRQRREAVRGLIGVMVDDCLTVSKQRLKEAAVKNVTDIRALDYSVIMASAKMYEVDRILKDFLFRNMYRHKRVKNMNIKAQRIVHDLFNLFIAMPGNLPAEWQKIVDGKSEKATAQVVADYIAGMTDRFAYEEHTKLFNMQIKTV
jgi:dGTPase